MTKITYIPGEIANAAIDEHGNRKPVTRTHHIFDDAKDKSQAEVNVDIDDALADRYTKAETYNKTELNNMITTPNQQYVSVTANSQTTAVTDVLPATGAADTTYRVGNWDGTQYNDAVFSEYAWNGSAYIKLSTKSQIGEVYDISANHADTKYADLAAALDGGNNIPQSLRKGGMSFKFVQSSDNKYVQFRLMSDTWSTNTENWAIAEEGVFVDNPEFVYVKIDAEDKILWAIKKDGTIFYGAGVPPQIVEYINAKIAELPLDEYEDIVAFMNGLEEGDKTLQQLLNEKLNAEGLDANALGTIEVIENPEWIDVKTDSKDKILEGIKTDGTKVIELPLEIQGVRQETIDNPEFIQIITDGEGKIIEATKKDGKKVFYAGIEGVALEKDVKDLVDRSLKQIINKSGSKTVLYIKKDGTGDFTDIQSAINSITDASISNQYELRVCDDYIVTDLTELWLVYSPNVHTIANPTDQSAYIITKDYINIVGYNRRRKIAVHSPNTLDAASYQHVQVMYLRGNVTVENIDFELKNGRYAIHQESGGDITSPDYNAITILRNVSAKHLGNYNESAWTAVCGQANGTCAGLKCIYENVEWSPMFYIHNNLNFDSPTYFRFKNCNIIPTIDSVGRYQGGYIDTYGCGQNFVMDIEGCNFIGMDCHYNVNRANSISSPCHDIRTFIPIINGFGNIHNVVFRQLYSSYCLCFESTSNNVDVDVIGGTALNDVFGDVLFAYKGTADAHGFICGTEYIASEAFTLGKRLGDCSSTNKTLIVKVGNNEQTITFDSNYTDISNSDIINEINNQLTDVTATMSSKDNSMKMYPYKDAYEYGFNTGESTILAGMPLVRDLPNYLGWTICPEGTKPEGMACERINPNEGGKVALLSKNVFRSIRDYGDVSGPYVKVRSGGYWTGAANKEEADLMQIAAGAWCRIN